MTFREDIKSLLMDEFAVKRKVRGMVLANSISAKFAREDLPTYLHEILHDEALVRDVQWMAKAHDGHVDFSWEDVSNILDALYRVLMDEEEPQSTEIRQFIERLNDEEEAATDNERETDGNER